MKQRQELLAGQQSDLVAELFPQPRRSINNRVLPWVSNPARLEGILWVLQSGAVPAKRVSIALYLWATAKTVAKGGRLPQCPANVAGHSGCRGPGEMEQSLSGLQFRPSLLTN